MVNEELQTVVVARQIFEQNLLWLAVRHFQVVDKELAEVAHDNPSWLFARFHLAHISLRLLERRENLTVTLLVGFVQVDFTSFLLNQNFRVRNVRVDVARV